MIKIQKNIPLAPYTTFKIGGPAKFFCEVNNEVNLIEALEYAKDNNLKIFILGGGSNVLISDDGFDGLVVRIQDTNYEIQDTKLKCGAGLLLSEAVRLATQNSLTGLEWAAGIPGTVGGAVRGNAGAYGDETAGSIEQVSLMDLSDYGVKTFSKDKCGFEYRNSLFKQNQNFIIMSCVLRLEKGEKAKIEEKIRDIVRKRAEKIPKEPSPGSFFKNPTVADAKLRERFEKDCGTNCRDGKIPAAWLIEEAGASGKKMGKVQLSQKHANFVVNLGGGKAVDVVILASYIKQQVRTRLGVQLQEEIQYVGFH